MQSSQWEGSRVFSPATAVTLVVFGAIGALIGWRRGTKALYRRSVSEPNLAPGESRRDYERRWRRRRKIQRLSGTLVYCVVGIGIALVVLAVATAGR
jgi:uncharacterized membrane protein